MKSQSILPPSSLKCSTRISGYVIVFSCPQSNKRRQRLLKSTITCKVAGNRFSIRSCFSLYGEKILFSYLFKFSAVLAQTILLSTKYEK